jgi:hypothetical protein
MLAPVRAIDQKRAMTSRLPPLAALALVAACGDPDAGRKEAIAGAAADADKVACAVEGSASFEPVCTVERTAGAEGLILTVRAPSGGFRRLLVTRDGRGVVAADGAEPALVSVISDDRIEVAIAGDRYRLPAKVGK